jgi:hypothetical protein
MAGAGPVPVWGLYTVVVAPWYQWHQKQVLETKGIEITGTVVTRRQTFVDDAGRYHSPQLVYTYAPKELANTADRVVRVERNVSEQDYVQFAPGAPIPLVYAPAAPKQSAIKGSAGFGPPRDTGVLALVLLFSIGSSVGLSGFVLGRSLRQRWLLRWGKAAKATIIGESEYTYKGARNAKLSYTFQDESGAQWNGQTTIPLGDANNLAEVIGPPTAVYDARDGSKNMLYPGVMYRLSE